MELKDYIRDVKDYPKEGIIFKDITPLWKDKEAFKRGIEIIAEHYKGKNIDKVVSPEARGFIMGAPVAYLLNAGFVPVRKPGKLPWKTESVTYDLEYGTDTLTIHTDAIEQGEKVLIIDDLLATGGTSKAIVELVEKLGGKVEGIGFLVELEFLNGRKKLEGYEVFSIIKY